MSSTPPIPPVPGPSPAPLPPPCVPDHDLIRRIGQGAYGEVWLARCVIGAYRAVKIVHRLSFDHDRPFEREFEGICKFEPVSRTHDSQVDILHVGRGDGCFYYVMELADDQATGGQINPDQYAPRTLKSDLQFHGRLPFEECVRIGIALATALEHLHANGLVHRDVKPSNIIFVNGVPKLADIGLVTGVDATRSYVGTEGFAAPEGPGTAKADLYSLGKVLYEAATGKDRQEFPELPTMLRELPDREGLMELNAVIARACRHDPEDRYASAAAMRADLELLQSGKSLARLHHTEKQLRIVRRAGALVTALAAVIAAGWWWQARQTKLLHDLAAERTQLLIREQAAYEQATKEKQLALKDRDRAVRAEEEVQAILGFVRTNIIAAARPQTELGGLGKNVTVRRALDLAERDIPGYFKNEPLTEAELRLELGSTYALLGDYARSRIQHERAAELRRDALGADSRLTLEAEADVAGSLALVGQQDEGISHLEQCVRRAIARFGPADEQAMDFLSRLGIAYRNGQRMDDALRTLQQAYHERSVCLGTDHINTLQALNHLAVTYQYAGQPQQAARLLEELRDRRARVLGPDHEDTTCAIIDLARVYLELGRWDEALPLFQSALETRRRIPGPDHYATLIAIDSLAMAFLQMGRFGEAEPLCRESLRLRESKLGPGHAETIDARLNLVRVLIEWSWSHRDDPTTPGAQVSAAAMRAREAERLCRSSLTDEEQLGPAADLRRFKTQTLLGSALVVVAATGRDSPLCRALTSLEKQKHCCWLHAMDVLRKVPSGPRTRKPTSSASSGCTDLG